MKAAYIYVTIGYVTNVFVVIICIMAVFRPVLMLLVMGRFIIIALVMRPSTDLTKIIIIMAIIEFLYHQSVGFKKSIEARAAGAGAEEDRAAGARSDEPQGI